MVKIKPKCKEINCDTQSRTRGWCDKHYTRFLIHGDPTICLKSKPDFNLSIEERFWSKVLKLSDNECWEWQAGLNSDGYGEFWFPPEKKQVRAHRFSWFLKYSTWPKLDILHSCDNTKCVNPNHFREGTIIENMQDMVARNRQAIGFRNAQTKLDIDKVSQIKKLLKNSDLSQDKIANKFGVKKSTIWAINVGKTWKYVV